MRKDTIWTLNARKPPKPRSLLRLGVLRAGRSSRVLGRVVEWMRIEFAGRIGFVERNDFVVAQFPADARGVEFPVLGGIAGWL
jgi:hypothetical protein